MCANRPKIAMKLLTILLMVFLLPLSGCKQEEPEDRITIAVSTIGPTHSWAEGVLYYAQEELKKVAEENDWDYICVVGNDANEQSQQVVELAEQDVDCIIMLPMDGASLKTAAIAVKQAGIPLVIFDREIPDFAPDATVKGDNPGIGTCRWQRHRMDTEGGQTAHGQRGRGPLDGRLLPRRRGGTCYIRGHHLQSHCPEGRRQNNAHLPGRGHSD